jgi:hypothetical protein
VVIPASKVVQEINMPERIEFKAPKGVVPDDIKPGDHFDLVSTYRLKDNGEICLIQIGDTKMPGYDEDEYEHETKGKNRESYQGMMDSMHSAMSEGNPGMGGGY